MPGEFLTPLTDKEPVLIEGFRGSAVCFDIELQKLNGLFLKLDEAVLISLSPDGEGFLLRIEVVEVEGCDLRGPGP